MKSESRNSLRVSLTVAGLFLGFVLGCSNPLGRFSKQYKCQIPGKAEPRTPYEYVERSSEHMQADQMDCALAACTEAIRLDSKHAAGYACRGGLLGNRGDYFKALDDLNYAIKLEPNNGDFYHTRAQIYDRLDKLDEAIADATKAIELISSEFGRSVEFAFRGSVYKRQSKLHEAIKDYDEAVKLAPDFAYHWGNRGRVYVALQDYNKAIADFTEAIKLDPGNRYFLRDRAEAYKAMGQMDLAGQDESTASAMKNGGAETSASPSSSPSQSWSVVVKEPVAGGGLEGKAISLPKPAYPPIGKAVRLAGTVVVQVTVNAEGDVTEAKAIVGHPLLQAATVAAARNSKFQAFRSGEMRGTIRYEFVTR
jgi:TonB family protein